MTTMTSAAPPRTGGVVGRILTAPVRGRAWRELGYLLVALVLGVVGFAYVFTAVTASAVLAVTFLGLPLLAAATIGARGLGAVHRGLAAWMLGEVVTPPQPFRPRPGRLGWIRSGLGDTIGWRANAYLLIKYPLSLASAIIAVVLWGYALGSISYPFWRRTLPAQEDSHGHHHRGASLGTDYFLDTWPRVSAVAGVGLLLLLLAPWVVRGLVTLDRLLIRGLLGPTRTAARMHDLERTRAAAVDDSAAALRRIERDLHDGAQVRLVAMAMDLGLVREQLAGARTEADLAATRTLVDSAHRNAKEALVELRDLARGIHPPILDRGIEAALATLVARSAVPVRVSVDLPRRPSAAIETITYFCVAELLTNITKHSGAHQAFVDVTGHDDEVRVTVRDDGKGGAAVRPGSGGGLSGLLERVRTVDGRLSVVSPPGGPTTVVVDLPTHA